MYGGNLRIVDQSLLPLQVGIVRLAPDGLFYGCAYALPHFRRSGIGESHNKEAVYVHRICRIGNPLDNPFYQHSRFSAPGRCGYQEVTVP